MRKSGIISEAVKIRDEAIVGLMFSEKVNHEELCALRIKDIDMDRSRIVVGKKTKRLNEELLRRVFDYWMYGRPYLIRKNKHDYFFVTKDGGKFCV